MGFREPPKTQLVPGASTIMPPRGGLVRRESTRLVKLPSRLEDDDPQAQLARIMEKCVVILRHIREKDIDRCAFFSEPVDLSTESFSLEPTGLDWYQAGNDPTMSIVGWYADEAQLTGAKLQCGDCDPYDNPCQNGGACEVSEEGVGTCYCPFSFSGTLCESAQTCNEIGGCMNNGTCNEYNYCK